MTSLIDSSRATNGDVRVNICAFGDCLGIVSEKPIHLRTRATRVYPPAARIALNVPVFEDASPRRGENSTWPVI